MTEQVPPTGIDESDADRRPAVADTDEPTTGIPAVDQVLADVDRLDELPLEEHLGAFERVHDSLRSALDARPDDLTGEHPGESA
jgi:hypothetical protein